MQKLFKDLNITLYGIEIDEYSLVYEISIYRCYFSEVCIKVAEVLEEPKRESKKLVTRHALARKILKKGVKLGVKKIFTDDGTEVMV